MGTVRSNQGIEGRCRALVPGTTSGDLVLATRTSGWDMITDWPRILTKTCQLKTFHSRQNIEDDKTHDTRQKTDEQDTKKDTKVKTRKQTDRLNIEDKVKNLPKLSNRHKYREENFYTIQKLQEKKYFGVQQDLQT